MWFIYSLGLLSGNEAAPCLVVVNFNLNSARSGCSCGSVIPYNQSCPSLCQSSP